MCEEQATSEKLLKADLPFIRLSKRTSAHPALPGRCQISPSDAATAAAVSDALGRLHADQTAAIHMSNSVKVRVKGGSKG